jgi:hypothetical protein
MLSFQEFDLKTGKSLTDFNPKTERIQRVKQVENCYLEKWLQTHQIEPQGLYVARFYNGVNDSDRLRLEARGKYLICTNGESGYFTDRRTARVIAQGDDRGFIQPIYADGKRSAHNAVAYGSLIVSDGQAAIQTKSGNSRILIIDDEHRSSGATQLKDRDGRMVPASQLADLYDKMGDGTMLTSTELLRGLLLDREVLLAIDRGLRQTADLQDDELRDSGDLEPELAEQLLREFRTTGRIATYFVDLQSAREIERQIDRIARSAVLQFRAATPDLPGIAKGSLATSEWCERLGVNAIVSNNDIKGDDGRLKQPGILELKSFWWVNRKIKAEYSLQSVGPQLKVTIPEATLKEFNPIMEAKASALAEVAVDNWQVAARFVAKEEGRHQRELIDTVEGENGRPLYQILKADRYGQLNQLPSISRQLNKSLRRDRLDLATNGIEVPAAIAQHHSKLEPWEICNRDLPHGAIVAYYRSPFPNVGAAAIGINNLEVLQRSDNGAFDKRGVAYLNPWTAKHIAITDFDGDRNGFFVGYLSSDNLPSQLRQQLSNLPLTGEERYEAGREVLAQIILQPNLERGEFPLVVQEFIAANAPERKPLPIAKAKKANHLWHEGEPLTQAIWQAWEVTANNPTAKVANQSIVLQSLAEETVYIDSGRKIDLLKQIGAAYSEIPSQEIPSDEYLVEHGLPQMQLAANIESIVRASNEIDAQPVADRLAMAERSLAIASQLLKSYCESAVAKNLQTAVDTAKSSVGIDESIYEFGERIQYKAHQLRQHVKKPDIYLSRDLPTNTQEPIGWAVETANRLYHSGRQHQKLQETESDNLNKHFRSLLPITHNDTQLAVIDKFARQYRNCTKAIEQVQERLYQQRPADRQPTLTIVSSLGNAFTVQRLCDADLAGDSLVWDLIDGQTNTEFQIVLDESSPEKYAVWMAKAEVGEEKIIGFLTPDPSISSQIDKYKIQGIDGTRRLTIKQSTIEFHPPYALKNDVDLIFARASGVTDELEKSVPATERKQYASAAWHSSVGMTIATKVFADEISKHLDKVPPIALNHPSPDALKLRDGEQISIRFERDYRVLAIEPDGSVRDLGLTTYGDSPLISPGTVVTAKIVRPLDPKLQIDTELGKFVVNPSPNISQIPIEEFTGSFIFDRQDKDIGVYFLSPTRPMMLGMLGRELINTASKANLKIGNNFLKGTLSRGANDQILEIHVTALIEHQPIVKIDRGERIPLPDRFQAKEPIETLNRLYYPTAGELRQVYRSAELAGDIAKMLRVRDLGEQLNQVFPNGDRAPDDFSSPEITVSENEQKMLLESETRQQSIEKIAPRQERRASIKM